MPPAAPTRRTSEEELNQVNLWMRQQPWYQEWFTQRGLNPNHVKLSRGQQGDLERLLAQQGFTVQGGMHIDQAGNLNQKNRLGKIAIAGGAAAATLFGVPGVFPGIFTNASTAASLTPGIPVDAIWTTAAGGGLPATASTAGTVATAGSALSSTLGALSRWQMPISWGLDLFNRWQEGRAASNRFEADLDYRNRVLESDDAYRNRTLEQRVKEFQETMEFERQKLGISKEQFEKQFAFQIKQWADQFGLSRAQFEFAQNQWRDTYGLQKAQFEAQQAERAPYRSAGLGALTELSRRMGTGMPPVERVTAPEPSPRVDLPPVTPYTPPTTTTNTLGDLTRPPQAPPDARTQTVILQAPDGSTRAVPADQADHYLARGARVLQGVA